MTKISKIELFTKRRRGVKTFVWQSSLMNLKHEKVIIDHGEVARASDILGSVLLKHGQDLAKDSSITLIPLRDPAGLVPSQDNEPSVYFGTISDDEMHVVQDEFDEFKANQMNFELIEPIIREDETLGHLSNFA